MDEIMRLTQRVRALEANRGASLRFGEVTAVSEEGHARVKLFDGENMVTHPLRVLQPRTLKDKAQCFPDIGEHVAVLFAGQGMEQGVILGAVYSKKDAAPGQAVHMAYIIFEDGTEIHYDRKGHKLTAQVQGEVEVTATGQIFAESQTSITAQTPGPVMVEGKASVTALTDGIATVNAKAGLVASTLGPASIDAVAGITAKTPSILILEGEAGVLLRTPSLQIMSPDGGACNAVMQADFTIKGDATLNGNLTQSGDQTVNGGITASGTILGSPVISRV